MDPSLLRYKDIYIPIIFFSNSKSVFLFFVEKNIGRVITIFCLKRMPSSILPEFGNCSSRLNFTTSPPRDARGKVKSCIYR